MKSIISRDSNTCGLLSVGTKVTIQINCKLSDAGWFIKMSLQGLVIVEFTCRTTPQKITRCSAPWSHRWTCVNTANSSQPSLCTRTHTGVVQRTATQNHEGAEGLLPHALVHYRSTSSFTVTVSVTANHHHKIDSLFKQYENAKQELKMAFIVVSKRI